ncbi:MAG: hypothetical protein ABIJ09_18200 [Pseudomonadota bacterium]
MSDTTQRTDLMEDAEEIRHHFEESIRFQKELKAKIEEEGRAHEQSNRLAEEQLDAAEHLAARVDAHAAAFKEMNAIIEEIEAHFAHENSQYVALFQAIEAREEAAQKAYDRIEEEDRLTDALEAELEQLRARLRFIMV